MCNVVADGVIYPTLTWIDSEQRAKDKPETWDHPDKDFACLITPGDHLKVGIEGEDPSLETGMGLGGERFWIQVTEVSYDGESFTGKVDNHLCNYNLPVGTVVSIKWKNVLDFQLSEDIEKRMQRVLWPGFRVVG